jgi:hypothetical protein
VLGPSTNSPLLRCRALLTLLLRVRILFRLLLPFLPVLLERGHAPGLDVQVAAVVADVALDTPVQQAGGGGDVSRGGEDEIYILHLLVLDGLNARV